MDSAIIFAPAGERVPVALAAATRGGSVVLAAIDVSDIPTMNYHASLFEERDLRTVTASTREDGTRLLQLAYNLSIAPTVTTYPFDRVDVALADLRGGRVSGSIVITVPD